MGVRGLITILVSVVVLVAVLVNAEKLPTEFGVLAALTALVLVCMLVWCSSFLWTPIGRTNYQRIEVIPIGHEPEAQFAAYHAALAYQQHALDTVADLAKHHSDNQVKMSSEHNQMTLALIDWLGDQLSAERRASIDLVRQRPDMEMRLLDNGTGVVMQNGQVIAPLDITEAEYWYVQDHGKLPPVAITRAG